MTSEKLNRQLETGRRLAMQLELQLAAVYAAQFRKIARQAAARFRALAVVKPITAAGGNDDTPDWVPPDVDELLNQPLADARAEKAATRIHLEAIELATPSAVRNLPEISFEVDSPFAKPLLEAAGTKSVNLGLAARDVILKVIGDSYTAGLSVPATAAALQTEISHLAATTALMQARTDLNGLANGASLQSVQVLGDEAPPFKTWLATEDERTRETHADADGQEVPIDQPFQVGDDLLMYPGDPDGSDAEVINCRCTLVYSDGPTTSEEADVTASATPEEVLETASETTRELGVFTAAAGEPIPWRAVLIVEGEQTADGRIIDQGAIDWRELPLTLMAMIETDDGHDGAQVAGRIDNVYRDAAMFSDGRIAIIGEGVFDTGDYGVEIARLVADETLRGVSADLGNVEFRIEQPATTYDVGGDEYEVNAAPPPELLHYVRGTILGATVCPFPAIGSGAIEIADATTIVAAGLAQTIVRTLMQGFDAVEASDSLTAAAAGATPAAPPLEWFDNPKLTGPTPLSVDDEGRVTGHIATWDVCHIGSPQGPNVCTTAPRSQSDYAFFHLGELVTAEGEPIAVGQVTLDTDHAGLGLGAKDAGRHYGDTGLTAAYIRAGEDRFGIWAAGAVADDLPVAKVRKLRAAKLSGDWRKINGRIEMIGVLAVNVPGFPIPRPASQLRASAGAPEMLALVAAGILGEAPPTDQQIRAKIAALAARALGREELIALALGEEPLTAAGVEITIRVDDGIATVAESAGEALDREIALQADYVRDHGYYSAERLSGSDLTRAQLAIAQTDASRLITDPEAPESVLLRARLVGKGLLVGA